jgi:membrane fusion protein (multidrug efflux system)
MPKPFARLLARSPVYAVICLAIVAVSTASCSDSGKGGKKGKAHLVELAPAKRAPLEYTTDRAGSLRALREVKLFNQEEGRITAVLAHEGDSVHKGQVLVRLDGRLLQAELAKARAARKQAEYDYERLKPLEPKQLVSENTVALARTKYEMARADENVLRTRLGYMTIRSPFDGKVAAREVEAGDVAPKHTHLMTVVDPSKLVTDVSVSELLIPRLHIGDRADVRIDALGDQVQSGKILRIYPTIDPASRRGRIEVLLNPVPEGAQAGQFCRVTLFSTDSNPLVVPFSALRRDPEGEYVLVPDEKDRVRRVSVVSGLRFADRVEIRAGLKSGQYVVTKGFLGLNVGARVKAVNGPTAADKKPDKQKQDGVAGKTDA